MVITEMPTILCQCNVSRFFSIHSPRISIYLVRLVYRLGLLIQVLQCYLSPCLYIAHCRLISTVGS